MQPFETEATTSARQERGPNAEAAHLSLVGLVALGLLGAAALAVRLALASLTHHPGHADEAFYYVVARNIADGRGFVIDYIWHYLVPPAAVTHPSHDYWLPLPSVFISIPIRIFGGSLYLAQLPGIAAGLALAAVSYGWVRAYSGSAAAAVAAAALVLAEPTLLAASVGTSSVIYYALFVSTALALMARGRTAPAGFAGAAAAAGLASLTRQDGLLLVPALMVAIAAAPLPGRSRARWGAAALGIYALVVLPLLVLNYRAFGFIVPPGRQRLLFLTNFEDLYSYSGRFTLSAYLEWGLPNILLSKLGGALINGEGVAELLGWLWLGVLAELTIIFTRPGHGARRAHLRPVLLFFALLYAFHTVVTTFTAGSGFLNSAPAIVPFALVIVADAVSRHARPPALALLIAALLAGYFAWRAIPETRAAIEERNALVEPLAGVKALVERDGAVPAADVVVMTRVPWELHYSTGYRAIQIPNDDLETILGVARRYRASYLLLPAPRSALEPLYRQERGDGRFRLVGTVPHSSPVLGRASPLKLFRIDPGAVR